MRRVGLLIPVLLSVALGPTVTNAEARSALGISCLPQGDVEVCTGSLANRVPSWDGTPLDVDIYLPANRPGPYPLIVGLHGFGVTKLAAFENPETALKFAREGYAAMAYSARGQGFSCGVPVSRTPGDCDRGWSHLADARYEVRDTQHLAGRLVDEGLARPRIGVTGSSYGGGQSLLLAALKDRKMLKDGTLVPWKSPKGTPMAVAAAAPRIGWSDLAEALVPTGRTLDYRTFNPYGAIGIVKQSYLEALFRLGDTAGYFAPEGADPEADVKVWKAALDRGEPYDPRVAARISAEFRRYRSAYYLLTDLSRSLWEPPAPTVVYNGWVDDIMPPDEALRWAGIVGRRFPNVSVGTIFSGEYAHNRGSLVGVPALANAERDKLFARYLKGDTTANPLKGVLTMTVGCNGAAAEGPFRTPSWAAQHPGVVTLRSATPQAFDSGGGSILTAQRTDPFGAVTECPVAGAERDPGAATYEMPTGTKGFTLLGAPTIIARMITRGTFPQVSARLWDVGPDGQQTFVQHGLFRPRRDGVQTFQVHPTAYRFAPGHRVKLELLGRDSPYARPSNGTFETSVTRLALQLPVREAPDGGLIRPYAPKQVALSTSRRLRQRPLRAKGLKLGVRCPREDCTVTAVASVPVGKTAKRRFRKAVAHLVAGERATVHLRMSRSLRRALRRRLARGGGFRTVVRLTATDEAGNRFVRRRRVLLR